jgi:peptide/nickel transport system substrate-binding protein
MRNTMLAAGCFLSAAALVSALSGMAGAAAKAAHAARAGNVSVLRMESSPETSVTQTFNPFVPSSASYLLGITSLIYEPLLQFDVARPTAKPYDFLATSYRWGSGGSSITFTIRTGVRFSNGTALTPSDVAFTYNLLKANPAINTTGLPIASATASGDDVTIRFTSSQYTNLQNIASVYIVPASIWRNVGNPSTYLDANPVGTGPYELDTFTPQGITLKANTDYWGGPFGGHGAPKVSEVEFPAIASNDAVLSELVRNELDWAGNFITGLQKAFETTPTHKVWFAPVNTVTLYPNLTTWPTNQLAVRQAISLAINRRALSAQGESGFEPPATSASGLVLPNFASLVAPGIGTLNQTPEVAQAKAVLEKAGFSMGKDGLFQKNGRQVSIQIPEPASYSDYAADGALVAQELRKAGIDATFIGTSVSAWATDCATGSFQMTIHWGQTSISAYQLYNYWLNSTLATGKASKNAAGDYERLASPTVDGELAKLASASTLAEQKAALVPIERYVASQLPVIPTTYGAAFDEYNTSHFLGWPSASDPYESGSPNTPTNEVVVLHLVPKG